MFQTELLLSANENLHGQKGLCEQDINEAEIYITKHFSGVMWLESGFKQQIFYQSKGISRNFCPSL